MTGGFVAWFEAILYNRVRVACRNIFVKLFVHAFGVLLMLGGLYYLLTNLLSVTGVGGMLLFFIGLLVFMIPLGVE
jgi:hypothetical protein